MKLLNNCIVIIQTMYFLWISVVFVNELRLLKLVAVDLIFLESFGNEGLFLNI